MKVLILTAITALALPFMAFGQKDEQAPAQGQGQQMQQGQEQATEPSKDTETTAPAKGKESEHATREQTAPNSKTETNADVHAKTKGVRTETRANEANARSTTNETKVKNTNTTKTKVNVQEFRTRHKEVFNLGVHPKTFFVQRYGENHVHLIGGMYFVFVDGCWVSVHADGYGYSERVICAGDPEYIEVN